MNLHKKNLTSSSSLLSTKQVEGDMDGNRSVFVGNERQSFMRRRLMRQRKLRYLTDSDVGFSRDTEKASSMPVSSQVAPKSRSPGGSDHWSSSAVPQPLPRPESPLTRNPDSTGSSIGTTQLVAGATIASLKVSIPRTSLSASDFMIHSLPPKSQFMDPLSLNLATDIVKNGTIDNGKLSEGVDDPSHKVRLLVATKSAPTSVLPSPTSSPRRASNFNLFPLSLEAQQGRNADYFSLGQTNHNRRISQKVQDGNATPLQQKSLPVISVKGHEVIDLVDAHPLPLPPNALPSLQSSMQLQFAVNHHHLEGSFGSPMKGEWQKGKLIGRGTFGSVYLATNRKTGASCAMKEVDVIPDDPKSAECIKQLEQEIKILRRLKHQNIVQYLGSELIDDHFYIYLEYVHPGSISKFIREHSGAMTESVVRNFTRHVLSGLAYLHVHKTIHRDVKGANLLVNGSGVVKLADFGMAKILNGQSYDLSLKGSPYWMAPEVMKAAILKDASPDLACAVDVWSLGCTIIEMFNGKPPWSEFEGPQAMFKVLSNSPPIPETLSTEGQDFLHQCFQRDPARRPTAAMLLDHPFVCNLQYENTFSSLHPQTSPRRNETGRSPSLRDSDKQKSDLVSVSRGTQIMNSEESKFSALLCKAPQLEQEIQSSQHDPQYNRCVNFHFQTVEATSSVQG